MGWLRRTAAERVASRPYCNIRDECAARAVCGQCAAQLAPAPAPAAPGRGGAGGAGAGARHPVRRGRHERPFPCLPGTSERGMDSICWRVLLHINAGAPGREAPQRATPTRSGRTRRSRRERAERGECCRFGCRGADRTDRRALSARGRSVLPSPSSRRGAGGELDGALADFAAMERT
jgi:hypothetical protein